MKRLPLSAVQALFFLSTFMLFLKGCFLRVTVNYSSALYAAFKITGLRPNPLPF